MNKWIPFLLLFQFLAIPGHGQFSAFVNHTEIGPLIGQVNDTNRRLNFSFQSFNGVKFHPNHSVGFLIGLDSYPGFNLMPLALGWRSILDKGEMTSPYLSLDIGYGSAWLENRQRENQMEYWYQGGFMVSPAIGIQKRSKNGGHAFSWSIGYKKQNASFYEGHKVSGLSKETSNPLLPPGFQSVREESYVLNSLFIKWGIVF